MTLRLWPPSRLRGAPSRARPGRRAATLGAILLIAALGYVALVLSVGLGAANSERHFGAPATDGAQQLAVYVEVLTIDPINETMRLRIHFAPTRAMRGQRLGTPDRDLAVHVGDGESVQEAVFRANEPMPPIAMDANLNGGAVASYPFDRFHAALRITVHDGLHPSGDPAHLLPASVTVWEGIAGWTLRAAEEAGDDTGELRLRLYLRRTSALISLSLAIYGVMALMAAAALTMGGLVLMRVRKVEATLAGCLSGMLFALPALRYGLPGAPPLGVRGDLLVFLWAELAVALGLLLFLVTWATAGPRD